MNNELSVAKNGIYGHNTSIMYIHQRRGWPSFEWDSDPLLLLLGQVRDLQGRLEDR